MYRKSKFVILMLIFISLAACSPTEVNEPVIESDRVTEVPESNESAASIKTGEGATAQAEVDGQEEGAAAESKPIDNILPKLPALTASNAALGGESMNRDSANMFDGVEFVLTAEIPQTPSDVFVVERTYSDVTVETVREIASQFQFSGQIYQKQLPMRFLKNAEINADGTLAHKPFYLFSENDQFAMIDGSLWINFGQTHDGRVQADLSMPPEFSGSTLPEYEFIKFTEELLSTHTFIDFDYTLRGDAYGNVSVTPRYGDIWADAPIMGFYFGVDQDRQPVLRSMHMDLYDPIVLVDDYPIRSAAAAWEALETGLEQEYINWFFAGGVMPVQPFPSQGLQLRSWSSDIDTDAETVTHIYGSPTVYNPVGEDGLSLVFLDGTLIQGLDDIGVMVATNESDLFRFDGKYVAADGKKVFVAESAVPLSYEDQLYYVEGKAVHDGERVLIETVDRGRFQLNNAPADLPDGFELFVNGYRNGEAADGTPLLDWQYISEGVAYSNELPRVTPPSADANETGLGTITVDHIELTYGIIWSQIDETSTEVESSWSNLLIPVWHFSGSATNGTDLFFRVPAIAPEYFSQN